MGTVSPHHGVDGAGRRAVRDPGACLSQIWAGPMPIHMVIATIIGVWLTFMLGTGLMALVFLSSGTGHDEQVMDRMKDEFPLDH